MVKKNKRRSKVAFVIALCCMILAIFLFKEAWEDYKEYKTGVEFYDSIRGSTDKDADNDSDIDDDKGSENISPDLSSCERKENEDISDSAKERELVLPNVNFKSLSKICPDLIAWLYCPGTAIDYPVVQGEDDSFYLTHLADGTENKNGCLFMEVQNASDFSNDNTIIYGHNMASGSMFAGLLNYSEQEYFEEHPVMYLITKEKTYELQIFAAYTTPADSDSYLINLGSRDDFTKWIRQMRAKSDIQSNVTPDSSDKIVTLSTCSYRFKNARYVVQGRLIEM